MNDYNGQAGTTKEIVLVVDDDPAVIALLKSFLEERGYQVESACRGEEALEKVSARSPDLVLLDVLMPGLDGFEVCRRLKAGPGSRLVPVILVTALQEKKDRIAGLEAGADDFLSKPFDELELLARCRNLLRIKRLTDQLRESYKALRELERLRDDLTGMIVHDINNLITPIVGGVGLCLEDSTLPAKYRQGLQIAADSARLLSYMADDLLDISRLEAGELPLRPTVIDLGEFLPRQWQPHAFKAAERRIVFSPKASPGLPAVEADPYLLERVLGNLLGNAVRYSPTDSEVRACAAFGREDGWVQISIANSGEPIPEEYHELIFEKFKQVELREAGVRRGKGIGLAFCKLAVQAHGSSIWVESPLAEGTGVAFHFTIPVQSGRGKEQ